MDDRLIYDGFIAVDTECTSVTTSSNNRGFNIVQLNVASCAISSTMVFDTFADYTQSTELANYINGLPMSTVLIGVTADEARIYLESNAINALLGIGVDATGLQYRGKIAFVAQIGRPTAAVMATAPRGGHNVKLSVSVKGITI